MRRVGPGGGIGCLVPRSGPNLALFESCGAMDGESCGGTVWLEVAHLGVSDQDMREIALCVPMTTGCLVISDREILEIEMLEIEMFVRRP